MQSRHIMHYIMNSYVTEKVKNNQKCGPMPNVMAALLNIGGALCSTSQSLADVHY